MSIARASIDRPLMTWLLMLFCLCGGLWGFFSIGRLEDPAFTIPVAIVSTSYPGASAEQVAREVSEPLETAIQGMAEVDMITSVNQPGSSRIEVTIDDTYGSAALPAIWTRLRAEVRDTARRLPDGVSEPLVNDSFGDVFGIFYAVTAEGLSDAGRHELATFLRRELLAVEGVADVSVDGLPEEQIFIDNNLLLAVNQNVPPAVIFEAVSSANSVSEAGTLGATRIEAPEGTDSVAEISALTIGVSGELLNLVDIARVSRGRTEHPGVLIRYNGTEAFTLGVAGQSTANIVEVGAAVDARLAALEEDIPLGVTLSPIYQQHVVVDEASSNFLVSLAMSVGIVVGVLTLFMGWRAVVVVGATLLLTVVGTFFFMGIFAIEMERISLGALIIAMGMLVDNAIVVAEGMQISMHRGKAAREAAEDTASKTQIPLLGATLIGIMAFSGIGLSPDATGEFLFSLFAVVGISLLLSWVLAITATPLLGHYLFRQGEAGASDGYDGWMFRTYGTILRGALRLRWLVLVALVAVTAACYMGFARVEQQFFPNSNTPLFFVHYKLSQGTEIEETSARLRVVEDWLADRPEVVSTSTFVGQGATRFLLTYSAESPNPSYGHIIIRTETIEQIPALRNDLEAFADEALPLGEFRTERLVFGPGGGAPIEVRFSGQDPAVLRELANEAMALIAETTDHVLDLRTDWREQELVLVPIYATDRAQAAGITRDDVSSTLRLATDGIQAGVYREDERLIPIIARIDPALDIALGDLVVYSDSGQTFIPLGQVIDGFDYQTRNTLVHRRDRLLTLTVQGGIPADLTAATVHSEIREVVEAMDLPIGYRMEWGGEFEASGDANESLGAQLPVSLLVMVLISVLLFNALRQPLIIWLLVPMAVNGVVLGLLGTGLPFTFTALLGLLSLSGMLIKNGIVLVEEIDLVRAEGRTLEPAIVEASVSRIRPVVLAAATTILGMAPLLGDAFFVSMAVTIMGGLAFASVLTLVAAPVFYRMFFAKEARREAGAAVPA